MQKTTLVILAAGLGSRFTGGIKQLTPVGPNGEIIIDYSIYDALAAGFDKIVFIIRRGMEQAFRERIGHSIETRCEVVYVCQELSDLPEGFAVPAGREKPWGTGHALLLCRGVIGEPFAVINSDDYYGQEAFVKIHDYLETHAADSHHYCMPGFILANTLSDNGSVTRGICQVDAESFLTDIVETYQVVKTPEGIRSEASGQTLDPASYVSMNMWGLTPEFLDVLRDGFPRFLAGLRPGDMNAEYLLPTIIGDMVRTGEAKVALLSTGDPWFGVTYAEDRPQVQKAFAQMVRDGRYHSPLYSC